MTIQTAIEKSIEGGWMKGYFLFEYHDTVFVLRPIHVEIETPIDLLSEVVIAPYEPLLDPKFWQALGKTMGWSIMQMAADGTPVYDTSEWHAMIDALAEGKTIEEYFETL